MLIGRLPAARGVARGIKAQPSYKLLPELGPAPPPGIEMTVRMPLRTPYLFRARCA